MSTNLPTVGTQGVEKQNKKKIKRKDEILKVIFEEITSSY